MSTVTMDSSSDRLDVIDEFLRSYERELDFYQEASRLCGQACELQLRAAGKRAIVTYRAKNPQRLGEKLRKRDHERNYSDAQTITDDIIDLAGVRVALYFPTDQKDIDRIIKSLFTLVRDPKTFPDHTATTTGDYQKQFSGYHATHYLVRLKADALGEDQQRYITARIEIQVASVLRHAWAEVEHDLSYKPLSGNLSTDEQAILDELNGMVLAGDIALERLQRAFERRVNTGNAAFTNHYELAAYLYRELHQNDENEYPLGRIDHFFQLLKHFHADTPDVIKPYLSAVITDPEHDRPIADQLIDLFITDNPQRYAAYEAIRARSTIALEQRSSALQHVLGTFLTEWISLEHVLQPQVAINPGTKPSSFGLRLATLGLPPLLRDEYDRLRHFRNDIVHGVNIPPLLTLVELTNRITTLRNSLQQQLGEQKTPTK